MVSIYWNKNDDHMRLFTGEKKHIIPCSSEVRNELNGRRPNPDKPPADEVCYALTKQNTRTNIAVMPRDFPEGRWRVLWIDSRTDLYRRPFLIMTDAWQWLDVWKLGDNGGYDKPAGHRIKDFQYGFHHSISNTTVGCGNVHILDDLMLMVDVFGFELRHDRFPPVEVVQL